MKIAVVGGNLLGCATALDLALVAEHDRHELHSERAFDVSVLERRATLGGSSLRAVRVDDELEVQVGAYATLPVLHGTFLNDLLEAANDARGTLPFFNRRVALPGATAMRRGRVRAAVVNSAWARGSYGALVRSYALWDWRDDKYLLMHTGWWLLDVLYRLLNNNLWRSVAFAMLLYSAQQLMTRVVGRLNRAYVMVQCVLFLMLTVLSPKRVVHMWQRNYSFWGTTAPLLFSYGITPAIARGSVEGFVKLLAKMNVRNVATCSISVGTLVQRAGLDSYLRSTALDYTEQFQYKPQYVARHIAPTVMREYAGARMKRLNALALQFSMLQCDAMNSDASERLCTIAPNNGALCDALIEAARATMPLRLSLNTTVTAIVYCEQDNQYDVSYADGGSERFDGVVLCASPKEGEMTIDTPVGNSLSELLGYARDDASAQQAAHEQALHDASQSADAADEQQEQQQQQQQQQQHEQVVPARACSHVAVVVGVAQASFFRFAREKHIPDCIDVMHAPAFSRFERVREVRADKAGVYKITCGEHFESSGVLAEMFEPGARLEYFAPLAPNVYSTSVLPREKHVDDCMPYIVLGTHFVYGKALRALAKHAEMDAIAAVNSASLFSKAVQWGSEDDKAEADAHAEQRGDAQLAERGSAQH